eukprot:1365591-Amorphochlora_amoeboformis.AAC.1
MTLRYNTAKLPVYPFKMRLNQDYRNIEVWLPGYFQRIYRKDYEKFIGGQTRVTQIRPLMTGKSPPAPRIWLPAD